MFDRLSPETWRTVLAEHLARVAPGLAAIDARLAQALAQGDRESADRLRTMRVYLAAGLFDADFYVRTYPDIQRSGIDPLEHFVRHGEREGRRPNAVYWPWHYRDDGTVRPPPELAALERRRHHAPMQVKQAFNNYLEIEEAFECYRRALRLPDGERLVQTRVEELRRVAEEAGGAFLELAPAGESFVAAPPVVVGHGNHRPLEGVARSRFVACLIDARVRGHSALIEAGGAALLDREGAEAARFGDCFDFDPAIFRTADEAADAVAWILSPGEDAAAVELDEAFHLLGPHSDGPGYWLWEYLPKYVAATMAGALPPVPVLIDADMPPAHRQALERMLPAGAEIVELADAAPARVRRLWCASSEMYVPLLPQPGRHIRWDGLAPMPERFAALVREMVRRADPGAMPASGYDRLFLARRRFRHRLLLNHQVVEAAAERRSFHIVDPEALDFVEQIRLVYHARIIAVPEGPGLFLALFARPGTRLCILSHSDTAGLVPLTGVLDELGVAVAVVTGPYVRIGDEYRDGSAYQIDEAKFGLVLDGWLEGAPMAPAGHAGRNPGQPAAMPQARRIAAFIGVKDEVEIIASVIDHHLAIGFDLIVACDVGSTDGTFDILERYRSDRRFQLMRIEDPHYPEQHAGTALALMREAGIDWAIFLDADEYCLPLTGNIGDCIGLAETDLLYVERRNVALSPAGPLMPAILGPDRYGEILLFDEVRPDIPAGSLNAAYSQIWEALSPKAMARLTRVGAVRDGMHDIIAADDAPLRWSQPGDLMIAHLPLSTLPRFVRKVDNIRRFFAAHDAAGDHYSDPTLAMHWRRWLALAECGLLDQEFRMSIFSEATVAELLRNGALCSAKALFEQRGHSLPAAAIPPPAAASDAPPVRRAAVSPAGAHLLPGKARIEAAMRADPADAALRAEYFDLLERLANSHVGSFFALLPEIGTPLMLRGATSDLASLRQILLEDYYGFELSPPRTILDLGAYCGYAAVYFANRFPSAQIVCVEPPGPNFAALVINTAPYRNIRCLAAAAWHCSTQVTRAGRQFGDWGNHYAERLGGREDRAIPAYTIADILQQSGWESADLIKCVVEGAQVAIVTAAQRPWLAGVTTVITRPAGGRWQEGEEAAMLAAFPEAEFDNEIVGEVLVLRRRAALPPKGPVAAPLPLIPIPPAARRVDLANVFGEFGFYVFDDDSIELTPNPRGLLPPSVTLRLELEGHCRFRTRLATGAAPAGAVRFGLRLRDSASGTVVAEAQCTLAAASERDWEVGFAVATGPHEVVLYTELPADEDAGGDPMLASFVAPTFF